MKQEQTIRSLVDELTAYCAPQYVYLFSAKTDPADDLLSFKLCIVIDTQDKDRLEHDLYLELDCEYPFDIVIYTEEEWERFTKKENSFAKTIFEKGRLIYGKEK